MFFRRIYKTQDENYGLAVKFVTNLKATFMAGFIFENLLRAQ